ncbi:hydroxyectoine utilization dehydratase EutB [Antarctobacter heliothermus]|uniref:L-threonine dehydratase n=1 Tax=Antarctobacter heliothermus TaxID=74033 RepID=A0A222E185_9RHOB|nr:threonine ammonia-lyase IlvA [Antarctobacter heliothermus]ASP19728.1 hydroxyectoine utilization dehydratase EutB [Antarctobacter heliothermus]MBT52613.1 threonine dehydratase [Mameliella sp.]|tara:strand:+ start:76994 stop:78220 length:1227 start_codon:yes stop_codon:yes gene_type:complete
MTDFKDKARAAEAAMRDVFPPTPLLRNAHLSDRFGAEVLLKREDLSPVRSYKLRGAFNAMRKARGEVLFVCASAGNHAQGVAYMCRHFGVQGVIFMPVTTPQQKIQKTRMFGGDAVEIRLTGDYFDDCLKAAQAFCATEGGHFLSPFDDEDVIEGQASVAVEIEQQLGRAPDHLVIPVGGGGLSAGMLSYFGTESQYTFVEPLGGACLRAALQAGRPVALPSVNTFADGAAVARIGERTFERLKGVGLANSLTIQEDRLCLTILEMLNVEGIVLEPAGALSVDALQDLGQGIAGRTVVCITSGGNFDFERLPEVKERAQRYSGIKKYFILRLPQRPGALKDFLGLLGPDDDIARFEYLKKSARNFGSVLIGIETSAPENFQILFSSLDAHGFTYQDITEDEILAQFVI